MKRILVTVVLLLGAASIFAQAPKPAEKQTQPTLQQRLEQTCQSIKSGELAKPQAQLADICRAYDDEQEKKKEQSKENMQFWSAKYCGAPWAPRSEEHTSELQSQFHLVCRLLLEKKKKTEEHVPLREKQKVEDT